MAPIKIRNDDDDDDDDDGDDDNDGDDDEDDDNNYLITDRRSDVAIVVWIWINHRFDGQDMAPPSKCRCNNAVVQSMTSKTQ